MLHICISFFRNSYTADGDGVIKLHNSSYPQPPIEHLWKILWAPRCELSWPFYYLRIKSIKQCLHNIVPCNIKITLFTKTLFSRSSTFQWKRVLTTLILSYTKIKLFFWNYGNNCTLTTFPNINKTKKYFCEAC